MASSPIHTRQLRGKIGKATLILALVLVAFAGVAATSAEASTGITNAVDVDQDGRVDAALREAGQAPTYAPVLWWLSKYDVGAQCRYFNSGYPYYQPNEQLTIRPPYMRPLTSSGRSSQPVAWRALFVDAISNSVVKYGAWTGGTAPTEFGGTDGNNVNVNGYYSGSESFTHSADTDPVAPYVQVAWLQPNGTWIYSIMRVNWMLANGYSRSYYGTC